MNEQQLYIQYVVENTRSRTSKLSREEYNGIR